MPVRKWVLLSCVLLGILAFGGRPNAAGPDAAFHAVGDLPGGDFTTVIRDATRVGGSIYAVGGGLALTSGCPAPCFKTDKAFLWTFDGSAGTLTALPDLAAN